MSVAIWSDELGGDHWDGETGCEVETVGVAVCSSQCAYLKMVATIIFVFVFHYIRVLDNQKIFKVLSAGRPLLV